MQENKMKHYFLFFINGIARAADINSLVSVISEKKTKKQSPVIP